MVTGISRTSVLDIPGITSSTFILGIVYRHPKGNVNNFITSFNEKLQQLKRGSTSKYYIVGDFNINVNPTNSSESSNNYLNMLASNGAFLLIDKPTRMFGETRTLIDHIITNDPSNIIYPCVFLSDISDHFPVACFVANNYSSKKGRSHINKVSYSYRNMSRFDIEQFRLELINSLDAFSTTLSLETSTDINSGLPNSSMFYLIASINMYPLKKVSRKKRKLISKPWITKGKSVSIKKNSNYMLNFIKLVPRHKNCFTKFMPMNLLRSSTRDH